MNQSAGAWLRASGRYTEFRLSNNEFCVALCLRYGKHIPKIVAFDTKCPCCKKPLRRLNGTNGPTQYCKVDPYGHHYISGCNKDIRSDGGHGQGAQPHAIHDAIRTTLHRIAKHALARSVEEPKHLLHIPGAATQLRPDLAVTFVTSDQVEVTYAVDVTITCPFDDSQIGVPKVAFNGHGELPKDLHDRRANVRRTQKLQKYKQTCTNKGIAFVPFVLYSTGKIHKEAVSFLTKLANHAEESRGISATTLLKYYIKLLNAALTKQVARVVCLKSLESVSPASSISLDQRIRTGNIVALGIACPQIAVHNNPRD